MLLTTIYFNRKVRAAFKACRFQVGEINAGRGYAAGMRVVQSLPMKIWSEKFDKSNCRLLI